MRPRSDPSSFTWWKMERVKGFGNLDPNLGKVVLYP